MYSESSTVLVVGKGLVGAGTRHIREVAVLFDIIYLLSIRRHDSGWCEKGLVHPPFSCALVEPMLKSKSYFCCTK
jgi:hypothetical protein